MGSEEGIGRDALIGTVGAVVLITAMAGVFFYERAQFEAYEVSWSGAETGASSESFTLTEGESETFTVIWETERMAEAMVEASWDLEATISVNIEGPGEDLTGSEQAASSPLDLDIPVQEEPSIMTVTARDEGGARQQLNDTIDWMDASGEWTITVTLEETPDDLPGIGDGAERTIEVTYGYTEWTPTLSVT